MIEAQPGALSAGHEDHAELARPQRSTRRVARPVAGVKGLLGGIQAEGRRRLGPRRQFADVVLPAATLVQPANQREVDGLDLPGERFRSA